MQMGFRLAVVSVVVASVLGSSCAESSDSAESVFPESEVPFDEGAFLPVPDPDTFSNGEDISEEEPRIVDTSLEESPVDGQAGDSEGDEDVVLEADSGEGESVEEPDVGDPVEEDTSVEPEPEPELGNQAVLLNASFPTSLDCEQTVSVSLEARNEGTTTWTAEAGYKLGTVDDVDPFHEATREYLPENALIPPGASYVFAFDLSAPAVEGVYVTDWQMVHEGVEWFGEIAAFEIAVTCPEEPDWFFSDALEDSVLQTATYIRENFPQFFNIEDMADQEKRTVAYEMMTTAINDLRNKGIETGRCIANPGLPESNPFHWCSDALVVGPPGLAVTVDIYQSWSAPANPQVLITETNQTGVVTEDLVPMP